MFLSVVIPALREKVSFILLPLNGVLKTNLMP